MRCVVLASVVALSAGASALGVQVEYRFTGVVTNTQVLPTMTLPASLGIGRPVSGFFRYLSEDAQVSGSPSPGRTLYDFPTRQVFAGLTAGTDTLTAGSNPLSRRLFLEVTNRTPPAFSFDQVVLNFDILTPSFPMSDVFSTQLSMALVDPSGAALPGVGVPTGPLPIAGFPSRAGTVFFESLSRPGEGSAAVFSIDTLEFVPAPGAAGPLIIVSAFAARRRVRTTDPRRARPA